MENWRRRRGGYSNSNPRRYQQSFGRSQSHYRGYNQQPQPQPGAAAGGPDVPAWLHSIPSWERKFIAKVGNIPWGRFIECNRGLELYKDVFKWDDSVGGEAFHNAKSRFWAEMNGLPCDLSLPHPDMLIDDVDWDTKMDPELYQDLEEALEPPEEEEEIKVGLINGILYYKGQPIPPTGWDDYKGIKATGWDSDESPPGPLSSLMKPIISSGCGDGKKDPSKPVYGLSPKTTLLEGSKKASSISNSWEDDHRGWEDVPWGQRNLMKNTTSNSWENDCGGSETVQWGQRSLMKKKTSNSWEDDSEDLEKVLSGQNTMKNTTGNSWEDNTGGWEELPSGQRNIMKNTMINSWVDNSGGWEEVPSGQRSIEDNGKRWETVPLGRRNTTNEYQDQNYSRNIGNWNRNENWRKKESEDQYPSRSKTTGYRPGHHQTGRGWRNNRGKKRVSFAQEQSPVEPLAPRQWNSINA